MWEDSRGLTKAAHFSLRWKCSKGENTGGLPVALLFQPGTMELLPITHDSTSKHQGFTF